jgi:hypothetical protein
LIFDPFFRLPEIDQSFRFRNTRRTYFPLDTLNGKRGRLVLQSVGSDIPEGFFGDVSVLSQDLFW